MAEETLISAFAEETRARFTHVPTFPGGPGRPADADGGDARVAAARRRTFPAPITLALDSFHFTVRNSTTIGSATGGAGAGKASFDALEVSVPLTADSPELLATLARGGHYDQAVLTQLNDSGQPVAVWVLDTVFIVTDTIAGDAETGLPEESLTFVFTAMSAATSGHEASWDQVFNMAGGPTLPADLNLAPLPAAVAPELTLELLPAEGQTFPAVTLALDSYDFTFRNPTTIGSATGGAGAGKVQFDALEVSLPLTADSPELFEVLVRGDHYDQAVLTQRNAAGQPVAVWVLETVFATTHAIDGDSEGPGEHVTFVFGAVTEATSAHQVSVNQIFNTADGPPLPEGLTLAPLAAAPATALRLELQPTDSAAAPITLALDSFHFTVRNSTTIGSATGGAGAGKASFDALEVSVPLTADSPELLATLARGGHYDQAVLTQLNDSGQPVAVWVLDTVFIVTDTIAGDAETGLPEESLTFVFTAMSAATSGHEASWDQVFNMAGGPTLPADLNLAPLPAAVAPELTLELLPAEGQTFPAVTLALDSYDFTFRNPTTIGSATGGAGAGKVQFDALEVSLPLTADSPELFEVLVRGDHYDQAVLTQRNAAGQPVAVWVLETVFATTHAIDGDSEGPGEHVTFVFGAVTEATSAHQVSVNQIFNTADGPPLPDGLTLVPLNNVAPADLALSGNSIPENLLAGTLVGSLSTSDLNLGDTFDYAFAGGPDDAEFTISGDQLLTAARFDFETKSSYSVQVRSTDAGGLSVIKDFTINVTNVNEAPTITVPSAQTACEDVDMPLSGIAIADPEGDALTVTLAVGHGTLSLGNVAGLTVNGNGSASVVLSGSLADLNAALGGLVYRADLNFGGADVLNITASDGSLSTTGSVDITVKSAANQAADLQALVHALRNAGALNGGQANSLYKKLELKGNNGDHGKVNSFLNEVAALRQAGILSQGQADSLSAPGNKLLNSVTRR